MNFMTYILTRGQSLRGKAFRIALVFAILAPLCSTVNAKTKLKFAIIAPERSSWGRYFKKAAKEIKEKTGGEINLKIYFGGVQGEEINVLRKLRIGQLDGAGFMARGVSNICPDALVFSIPLQFHSSDEAVWVNAQMKDYFKDKFNKKGFHLVDWTNQGFTYCFSKNKVDSISALRQAKPWMIENDAFCKTFFKCASISAIPVQVADVLTALQSGLIRTVFAPPIALILMQWQTRVKYVLDMGVFYSFGAVVFSQKKWKRISEKNRKIIDEVLKRNIAELNVKIIEQNAEALEVLAKSLETVKPGLGPLKEFRSITKKVEEEMTGKNFSAEAMQLLKKNLKEYRAKNSTAK